MRKSSLMLSALMTVAACSCTRVAVPLDAGPADAGPRDAGDGGQGSGDFESSDAGLRDAGSACEPKRERCDGADQDCDGTVDEGDALGCVNYFLDADGDGSGVRGEARCTCAPSGAYRALAGGDCDDDADDIAPGREEACDAKDNDCDGRTDEQVGLTLYVDADLDGWGTTPVSACEASSGMAPMAGDCAPTDASIHPGASELCDTRDNDCDATADEGLGDSCEPDVDGDGVFDSSDNCPDVVNPEQQDQDADEIGDACDPDRDGDGSPNDDDCGPDADAQTPGRAERCDGFDNDCDDAVDETFELGKACETGAGTCRKSGTTVCDPSGLGTTCNTWPSNPAYETCDGTDEDCDQRVDESEVCPDSTVANTRSFDGGVWYTSSNSNCAGVKLLQFWPTFDTSFYYSGFDCDANFWQFRQSDFEIFYNGTFDGIWQHNEGESDEVLPTPPCQGTIGRFGFDASNRFYYQCGTGLFRDSGELIDDDISQILAVFADGRVLVLRASALVVIDEDGAALATLNPWARFAGSTILWPSATTVWGNDAFLLLSRSFPGIGPELVVMRINASNELLLVRRTPVSAVPQYGSAIPIPDGTVFWMESDPAASDKYQIRRLATDGTSTVVWREVETTFDVHIQRQLLLGPRRP